MADKQYVNLPYDADKKQGDRIVCEVTTEKLSDDDLKWSEWWVEATGANTDEKYLSKSSRARVKLEFVASKKKKFKNDLYLPHVGGDKYKVKCSKKGDKSKAVEQSEVETWRKLFYTVHYMNDDCKTMFNGLKSDFESAYDGVFIELERVGFLPTLEDEPRTKSSNTLGHLYKKKPKLSDRPFHLRLVVINDIYVHKTKVAKGAPVTAAVFSFNTAIPMRSGKKKDIQYVQIRIGKGKWKNVTKYAKPNGDKTIDMDLSKHKGVTKALADGKTIKLKYKIRGRSHYLGHSIGNFCCVRIKEDKPTEALIKRTILQTLTHELGHSCQQTAKRERLYTAKGSKKGWEKNPTWYNDKWGGQGPHCNTNAKKWPVPADKKVTETKSGQLYVWDAGTLCTMYHADEDHVDAKGDFCASCKPRVKRVNLDKKMMKKKGWNSY